MRKTNGALSGSGGDRIEVSSFFKLHVIPPPRPLDWTSPRTLLKNTLWHHLLQDQAPIGHFYIEIKSRTLSKSGASHVLTGMSRLHANRSSVRVVLDQIGLGTFFHDFPGKLDRGALALRELEWAKKKGRWKSVTVPLPDDRAELLFEELGAWIENGSFRHYGGGHEILKGEGGSPLLEPCARFESGSPGLDPIGLCSQGTGGRF